MDLRQLGWNSFFKDHFQSYSEKGLVAARVVREHRRIFVVWSEYGEYPAELAGKIDFDARAKADYPTVGDWVAVEILANEKKAVIKAVLPRKSKFCRKGAHKSASEEQVVAVNVDTVFLVTDLDRDFNLRRLERYLLLAWDSGAKPVVILNKSDLCDKVDQFIAEVKFIAPEVPIHPVSATEMDGLEPLRQYFGNGQTVAMLGSSGVGKSTIINSLLGMERLAVGEIRQEDGRGRHTTTHRELILLPEGGAIIDNPGMRELHVWTDEEGIRRAFEDIEEIAAGCKYRNCLHDSEPQCAVRQAIEEGALDWERVANFQKLMQEMKLLEQRLEQSEKVKERTRVAKRTKRKTKKRKKKKK